MRAAKAVIKLRPGAEFTIDGPDLVWATDKVTKELYPTNLTWITQTKQITKGEYDNIMAEVIAEEPKPYQHERMMAYPPMAMLADAIYWQQQGDNTKMEAYLEAVKNVKEMFPKG